MAITAPTYRLPSVPKISAGYWSGPGLDLIDLFIGSEGTLGVVVEATLRVVTRPRTCVVVLVCDSEHRAVDLTRVLREASATGTLDVAAIEYVDAHALALLDDDACARAGLPRPSPGCTLLIAQIEVGADTQPSLETLGGMLDAHGWTTDPLVALPDSVLNNSRDVDAVAGTAIDQAFIGSCANGTLDDLALAARVLKGRKVSPETRLIVTPASQHVYRQALRAGVIEVLAEAGAVITNPTCGACGGSHLGLIGPEENCITASTRNFKGRMGDPSSKVFMASPATVAASAIRGAIAHPGDFLH